MGVMSGPGKEAHECYRNVDLRAKWRAPMRARGGRGSFKYEGSSGGLADLFFFCLEPSNLVLYANVGSCWSYSYTIFLHTRSVQLCTDERELTLKT